jgi:hypothetical protein
LRRVSIQSSCCKNLPIARNAYQRGSPTLSRCGCRSAASP